MIGPAPCLGTGQGGHYVSEFQTMKRLMRKRVLVPALIALLVAVPALAWDMHDWYPGLCYFTPSFCDWVNCQTGGPCP